MKRFFSWVSYITIICLFIELSGSGCANIIPPGGGPRDSIPPRLFSALPRDSAHNVNTTRINLTFNEYIDAKDAQTTLIVSPYPKNQPIIEYKLKTINIRLRDSLEPNTTYTLNFGNSLKDVNEGNAVKNFYYVFSTGSTIDSNTYSGKVFFAETGKADSTLIVVLHKNTDDTAIMKSRPRYYTTLDGKGNFTFRNLPAGTFAAYVLPQNNYAKKYDDSTLMFAFLDHFVVLGKRAAVDTFYAYEEAKRKAATNTAGTPTPPPTKATTNKDDKRLKYATSLENGRQDLLNHTLQLEFARKLKSFDPSKIILTDTNYQPLTGYKVTLDTGNKKIFVQYDWKEDVQLRLLLRKDAVADSAGTTLTKADTIRFSTKRESEYGSVHIRFTNLDLSKNPVLQLVQNDVIIESIPVTTPMVNKRLYTPGDYEMRVLFDKNKNGIWDSGNFKKKIQPETVLRLTKKLSVKANYDDTQTEIVL